MIFSCAQRGCRFEIPDSVTPATLADDGVTVLVPEQVQPPAAPSECPGCGHPFVAHPAPASL